MAAELTDEQIDAARDAFDWDGWIEPKNAQRAFVRTILALATQQATQGGEPGAWAHEDDPARVISATQKAQTLRDGGASASSVRPYSVALYTAPTPTAEVEKMQAALVRLESAVDWYLGRSAFTQTTHLKGFGHSQQVRKELFDAHDAARAVLQSDQAQAGKGDSHDQ